ALVRRLVGRAPPGLCPRRRWQRAPLPGPLLGAHQEGCSGPARPIRSSLSKRRPPRRRHTGQIMNDMRDLPPAVSVVVPVRNEAGNVAPLVEEIAAALEGAATFEIIYVNDGSTDATEAELTALMATRHWLRQVKHGASCGQSAAVRTGASRARAPVVVTLDGDGQNNPAFIPALLKTLEGGSPRIGLVAGQRTGRKDTGFKKFQSRIANGVRGAVLRDGTRDTGCGLKAFRRDLFLSLPYFDGLHRFLPALMRREGYEIGY